MDLSPLTMKILYSSPTASRKSSPSPKDFKTMDPAISEINISDVVQSTAGRDQGQWFYVIEADPIYLMLANGKDRTLEKPKRKKRKHVTKVLRSETRVAEKIRSGDKVLNSELRRDLAFHASQMQANNLGG